METAGMETAGTSSWTGVDSWRRRRRRQLMDVVVDCQLRSIVKKIKQKIDQS
jgi:hypothetical protein